MMNWNSLFLRFWLKTFLLCVMIVVSGISYSRGASDQAKTSLTRDSRDGNRRVFPNAELTDHTGRKVRFYDDLIKGKIFLVNFIFTSCTDYCPMETARVRRIQDLIGDRLGKDIFFYSISIDPENDTPAVLSAYREKFGARPGWDFFTGNEAEIAAMRRKMGLLIDEFADDGQKSNHSLNMLIGSDIAGQWMRRSNLDRADVVAKLLTENLSEWRMTGGLTNDFAKAPTRIKALAKGEEIFKTRCADCHSIGAGDALGPDLKNVTRTRDVTWLKSWLKDPAKLIATKDPIALELLGRFRGLVMPNLGLTNEEIVDVIEFMERASVKELSKVEKDGEK